MIKSMTGFGKASIENEKMRLNVEIRCLNSKQMDIVYKSPGILREKELEVRGMLGKLLHRGKVEINIYYEDLEETAVAVINPEVVSNYKNQITELEPLLGKSMDNDILQVIMNFPDVLKSQKRVLKQESWKEINSQIEIAVSDTLAFRSQEGKTIESDVTGRIRYIQNYLEQISEFEEIRIDKIKTRIREKIEELNKPNEFDENRLEQEIIYYIEKLDITEEKVRLKNHIDYFLKSISSEEPVGKKLGFITQEIGREINTIGSKANDSDIQKIVVKMKDELEKIKEQLLNIL
ncbi:MAG: YicC/YloC family endoribonuclease [Bacteroidota bacterium]|nr:YicC/YloC family endoribonuclease [Bacteroidota bacterium]